MAVWREVERCRSAMVRELYGFWNRLRGAGELPHRADIDPAEIKALLPNMLIVDFEPDPFRVRYRLVGTKEVETLEREVTGEWLDDVHPRLKENPGLLDRYRFMVEQGKLTYRNGFVNFSHKREHVRVENFMAPLARDGRTVDIIAACSVNFLSDGRPT